MKIAPILLTLYLTSCLPNRSSNNEHNINNIYPTVMRVLKSEISSKKDADIYGAWQSESSNTLLLIDEDNKAIVLNVILIGDAERLSDGTVQIKRTFPTGHSSTEVYGVLQDGKIVRQKYDYAEFFDKKTLE